MSSKPPKDQESLRKTYNRLKKGLGKKADFSKVKSGSSSTANSKSPKELEAMKKRIKARELKKEKKGKDKKSLQSKKNLAMESARADRKRTLDELRGG